MAWQALVVGMVIVGVGRVGRRLPSNLREALLGVALIKFLLPPIALPVGIFPWLSRFGEAGGAVTGTLTAGAGGGPWLPAVYWCGVAVMAAAALRSAGAVRGLRRGARPADAHLVRRAGVIGSRVGLRRAVDILVSDEADAPMAVGFWSPAVVLPASMVRELSAAEIDAVLGHELAHHARGHLAWLWLRAAACTAWWWHPVAWLVAWEQRRVSEETCDDLVVSRGIVPGERYCDVLIRAARVGGSGPMFSARFAARLHPLGRRIRRMLDGSGGRTGSPALRAAIALIAAVLLLPALPVERTLPPPDAPAAPALSLEQQVDRLGNRFDAAVDGFANRADRIADRLATLALFGAPADAPDERERGRIAAAHEQQIYASVLESGAPDEVARSVSRSVSRSISGGNTRFWRNAGRAAARLFR